MLVICPSCFQKNNLDLDQPISELQCQHCLQGLSPSQPIELDDAGFQRLVPETQALVLVAFWTPACGRCQAMVVSLQHIAKLYPNLCCAKINTETQAKLTGDFQIKNIPSLLLFRQNQVLARIAGAMNIQQIKAWLAHHGVHP